nr:nitric oxide-sensing protein NosP [Ventosimonas gracilis]
MQPICEVIKAMTSAKSVQQAAQELAQQLIHPQLGFVLFFCSAEYDLKALGQALDKTFAGVPLVGCTTAGEITSEGYARGCISAVGFDKRCFAVASCLIEETEPLGLVDAQPRVERLIAACRSRGLAPIKGHSFALTLLDGLSSREETLLAVLSAALGSIPQLGGSAGDDNHLACTHVYWQGRFHSGAAVLVLFNTWCEFEVFSTCHIRPREEKTKLVVTRADSAQRRVYELNAEPAALEYARLIGMPLAQLDFYHFAMHPLSVRMGEHYYVRSIQQNHADQSLSFYCAVETGMVLTAMRPVALLTELEMEFVRLEKRLGSPMLTIGFDCFLRRLELEASAALGQANQILRKQQVMGFSTYGE